jgi:hypothetical protein
MGMKRRAMMAALLLFAVAGCGKSQAVKDVEALADEMCACRDIRCATEVTKKASELLRRYADVAANDSTVKALEAAAGRMRQCAQQIGR